ncbi:MAG TPA: class I SAM-dependent methyltransferase [Gemmatimonadaceae bacterium]|nr:class I SAM-dependent methyltransferase [Gemmatimonadaceae bacterium]
MFGGIPDLRIDRPAWIDIDDDREAAARLDRDHRHSSLETMVRAVFVAQEGRSQQQIDMRTRQVLVAPDRLATQLDGWLRTATHTPGFLDLGCGPGMLLAAAARAGVPGLGIDVSLIWLVVARRMIEQHGGQATLCAAFAESLPLPNASVPAIVSLDVIEHVADQPRYLAEIDRIAADGAAIALATPNRFSLAAEPHVHVWGVGWLPARFQKRYVRARSGRPYEFVCLLSVPGLARLLRRHTQIEGRFLVPHVPDDEIASYNARRAMLARAYNRVAGWPWLRWPLLAVGPFFRFTGKRRARVADVHHQRALRPARAT